MNRYTIHCSKEQTKKALELGAQIEVQEYIGGELYADWFGEDDKCYRTPTAEQMRGWLEGQGIYIIAPIPLIKDFNKKDFSKADAFEYRVVIDGSEVYSGEYLSGKEATLAAIDAALEYLADNKL